MKVISGNIPQDLLNSRITATDRENLSTLIPQFGKVNENQLPTESFTYQDVYETAQKTGLGATEISSGAAARMNNLSTLLPRQEDSSARNTQVTAPAALN